MVCLSLNFPVALGTDKLTALELGEQFPGGAATHRKRINANAFSHASANITFAQEMDFKIGNGFFKRLWVSAPASTQAADGLGPLFNARACQRCHIKDGRGHPPESEDDRSVSMFLRVSIPAQSESQARDMASGRLGVVAEPTYGTQLQELAVQGHQAEGRMRIRYDEIPIELADGTVISLRKPTYSISDLGYGELHPDTMMSPRVAPQMIGLGLLEAIEEADIGARVDIDDQDTDGISGKLRLAWSPSLNKVMIGRFGWKGGNGTVPDQSQGAFKGDMGLSTPLHPAGYGECSHVQTLCREAPHGNSPQYENLEVHTEVAELVEFYSRNLAVPPRREADHPDTLAGKALFHQTGCAACHTPSYRTGLIEGRPEHSNQLIWPYTDLLLHDMGEGLADHRPEGNASGREWKTPPLWGIGLTPIVNGHSFYLHDGRARSLLEAILWHGGEAKKARDKVIAMDKAQRDQLVRFVESL